MKIKIKDFRDEGENKLVGFMCTRDSGSTFAIDRYVPLGEGKTDEDYISDAYGASGRNDLSAKAEIEAWANRPPEEPEDEIMEEPEVSENIGKQWNPEDGVFAVEEEAPAAEEAPAEESE